MLPTWCERILAYLGIPLRQLKQPQSSTASILVPSRQEEVPFRARIHLSWLGSLADPIALEAVAYVTQMAKEATEEITRRYSVVHLREAQDALTSRLPFDDRLRVGALPGAELKVLLDADPEAVEIARRFEEMRMEAAFTQVQHQLRFQQWDDLRREVLAVPHRARLWWLDGRSDRLEQLVTMGNVFEEAAALLTPEPRTAPTPSPVAQLSDVMGSFLRELEPAQRQLLLQQLSLVFVSYARPDLADATQEMAGMLGATSVGELSLTASVAGAGSAEDLGHGQVRSYP